MIIMSGTRHRRVLRGHWLLRMVEDAVDLGLIRLTTPWPFASKQMRRAMMLARRAEAAFALAGEVAA
jgi:hypothetical protein